jgi:ribosomal protein S18 acetylase RimI-like enzyme
MVHPSAQGQGIGKEMCKHSLQEAKRLGFVAMQFNLVVSTNLAAVHLWEKLGFSIVGTIPIAFHHQELGYVDAYIMYQSLS